MPPNGSWSSALSTLALVLSWAPAVAAPRPPAATIARQVAEAASDGDGRLTLDPSLARAAERHLAEVLADPRRARRERIETALADEGLADAQVLPFVAVGQTGPALIAKLLRFAGETARPRAMTHVGVAWVEHGSALGLAALFTRRLVALSPLPRRIDAASFIARGRVRGDFPLEALVLTPGLPGRPTGDIVRAPVSRTEGGFVDIALRFDRGPGRYTLELLADASRGPEVVALWRFQKGTEAPDPPPASAGRGRDGAPADREERLRGLIRALRQQSDLGPLVRDPALERAARVQAEAVCATRTAAHVLNGSTPLERARAAGYAGPVTENLAIASSVRAAHQNLIASPAHLRNILDPVAEAEGIAVETAASTDEGTESIVCVVELFGPKTSAELEGSVREAQR